MQLEIAQGFEVELIDCGINLICLADLKTKVAAAAQRMPGAIQDILKNFEEDMDETAQDLNKCNDNKGKLLMESEQTAQDLADCLSKMK